MTPVVAMATKFETKRLAYNLANNVKHLPVQVNVK